MVSLSSRAFIRPSAKTDIDEALAWYAERDARLVQRMLAELDHVFERITPKPRLVTVME